MSKTNIWLAAAMAVAFAVPLALEPAGDRVETAAIMAFVVALVAALRAPAVRRFILGHPRAAVAMGLDAPSPPVT